MLLALLSEPRMPEPTRRLCRALSERRIHKRAVEISARAGHLYRQLGALYSDPARRRMVERAPRRRGGDVVGVPVPRGADPDRHPQAGEVAHRCLVSFRRPPVGFEPLMPWREVVGLADDDLKRYEEHRRLIRIVTTAELRAIVRELWESVLPAALAG